MSKPPPDKLLAAISKDQPSGVSLRYDPAWDRIQEARREDDPNVPQGVWTTKLKKADWSTALAEIDAALAKRSKDLQLAAWRVEALLQIEGLPGFARGIRTVAALCQRFWPTLHPQIEDDDIEGRLSPLYWLDEKLPTRIGQIPIAAVPWADDKPKPSWSDLQSALRIQPLANSKPDDFRRLVDHGAATQEMIEAAMRASPIAFFLGLHADIADALDAIETLHAALDKVAPNDAPHMRALRDQLDKLSALIAHALVERGVDPAAEPEPPPPPATETEAAEALVAEEGMTEPAETEEEAMPPPELLPAPVAPTAAPRRGIPQDLTVTSRQDAYRLLALAADYLEGAEPHSPAPHLIRRAIAWGQMPFSELLKELVDEPDSRRAIHKLLNLPPEA